MAETPHQGHVCSAHAEVIPDPLVEFKRVSCLLRTRGGDPALG